MINQDIYLTQAERQNAFKKYCQMRSGIGNVCNCRRTNDKDANLNCYNHWLKLTPNQSKPNKCIYCGGEMVLFHDPDYGYGLLCMTTVCGASSYRCKTPEEAIELYNKVSNSLNT